MLTTQKLLAALKKANGDCSDYRVSKLLGISTSTVSNWSIGRNYMGEETARKAAQLLGWSESYVVACIHAEQVKDREVYPVWVDICRRLEHEQKAA